MVTNRGARDSERRAGRHWHLVGIAVLVIGIVASFLGAHVWRTDVHNHETEASRRVVTSTSQALASELERDADFTGTATTLISTTPSLTNTELARWFHILDGRVRYPGAFGLSYIESVPRASLATFATEMKSDPPFGISSGPFRLSPPGVRTSYCLTRYGYAELPAHVAASLLVRLAEFVSPGFDYCAQEIDSELVMAGATGKPTVASLANLFTEPVAGGRRITPPRFLKKSGIMTVLTPVYANSAEPTTRAARLRELRGWVLGLFDANEIVAPALRNEPGASLALAYRNPNGSIVTVDPGGKPPRGATRETLRLDGTWTATLAGVPISTGIPADDQGLAVLGIGIILSLLLFFLMEVMSRSRTRALDLVEERTSELEHQALHDPLTGLANRTLVFDRVSQMLARAARDHLPIAVLVVDLDGFKFLNDSLGHDRADELLVAVARRLQVATRASDGVGRIGGDEFVVLAEGSSVAAGPEPIAERILGVIDEPYELEDGRTVTIGASIGVATGLRASTEQLMKDAQAALYEAKSGGRNHYVVFDPDVHAVLAGRAELDEELSHALARHELKVVYQPIVRLDSGAVVKMEALLRWQHPKRGVVSPMTFVPAMEESGLIAAVGRAVLEESCRQASDWQARGYERLGVAVNVSPRQLESDALVGAVEAALSQSGLEPDLLTLEITESTIMRDTDATVRRLSRLKELGVKLAVDDFGTGYSSLAYLQRFPVDELKIDRSFVSGGDSERFRSRDQTALIRTLVQLGRLLGLETVAEDIETVAEGIETRAQLERLRAEGCDCGQGYLFSRPMDVDGVEEFLQAKPIVA